MPRTAELLMVLFARYSSRHLIGLAIFCLPQAANGQLHYDFVDASSQETLATLELSGLPATHEEVVHFAFSPQGAALFTDVNPPHQFWRTSFSSVTETMPRNLGCTDCGPDQANWFLKFPGALNQFKLWFSNQAGMDQMTYEYDYGPPPFPIVRNGDWVRSVPAPVPGYLWVVICIGFNWSRR